MAILALWIVAPSSARAEEPPPLVAPLVCDAYHKCGILMGADQGEQTRLADLTEDILRILDAPEQAWVHKRDRPPATVTLTLAEFLRHCLDKVMRLRGFLIPPCLNSSHPAEPHIVERLIPWPAEREALMQDYLREHTGNSATELRDPTTIVTHWTATSDLESTIAGFSGTELSGRPGIARAGRVNVSCHFIVDRDGTIYQLMPEDRIARHAVGMNRNALCIENIGGPEHPLTPAQLDSDEAMIRYLASRHPTVETMIGHSEYRGFEETYIFSEKTAYRSDRVAEPGKKFLADLRERLDDPARCSK